MRQRKLLQAPFDNVFNVTWTTEKKNNKINEIFSLLFFSLGRVFVILLIIFIAMDKTKNKNKKN